MLAHCSAHALYLCCSGLIHWVVSLGYPVPWLLTGERERRKGRGEDNSEEEGGSWREDRGIWLCSIRGHTCIPIPRIHHIADYTHTPLHANLIHLLSKFSILHNPKVNLFCYLHHLALPWPVQNMRQCCMCVYYMVSMSCSTKFHSIAPHMNNARFRLELSFCPCLCYIQEVINICNLETIITQWDSLNRVVQKCT